MLLKKNIAIIILIFGVLNISTGLLLNSVNLEIRLKELTVYLQQQNRTEYNSDHIHLISRYSLHQKLYKKQISREKADQIEFRFEQLIEAKNKYSRIPLSRYSFIGKPALVLINFNRKLLGKPPSGMWMIMRCPRILTKPSTMKETICLKKPLRVILIY